MVERRAALQSDEPGGAPPLTPDTVRLAAGAEDNGLASMMASLLQQNLEDHPERLHALRRLRGRAAVVAEDAEVAMTLACGSGRIVVHDGIYGIPDLTIRATAELITDLSRMESLPNGLPDPRGEVNRAMVSALRAGRLRIFGIFPNLRLLIGLGELLAIE